MKLEEQCDADPTANPHKRACGVARYRTVCIREGQSMLTRSLFTFAALSLFAVSALAQDIPAKLVPPQPLSLVGK
jgi:hypothetical protein